MKPNAATMDEIVDHARQRGSVSLEDLRQCLPIERMTIEDISYVLARLDEAGFDLEIDPMMLLSAGGITREEQMATANQAQAELPEPITRPKAPEMGFRTSPQQSPAARQPARSSQAPVSAPMLPWVLAFVIVVLVFFAAFAF